MEGDLARFNKKKINFKKRVGHKFIEKKKSGLSANSLGVEAGRWAYLLQGPRSKKIRFSNPKYLVFDFLFFGGNFGYSGSFER